MKASKNAERQEVADAVVESMKPENLEAIENSLSSENAVEIATTPEIEGQPIVAVADKTPVKNVVEDYTRADLAAKKGSEIITPYHAECDPVTNLARTKSKLLGPQPGLKWRPYIAALVSADLNADVTEEMFSRNWNKRSYALARIHARENPQSAVANTAPVSYAEKLKHFLACLKLTEEAEGKKKGDPTFVFSVQQVLPYIALYAGGNKNLEAYLTNNLINLPKVEAFNL